MSEFAFFRFLSLNLLTQEETENKTEIISVTEQVLDAEGIECDSKIAKLPEKINKILAEVRKRRCKRIQSGKEEDEEEEEERQESPVSAA